jgi:hypothetical protein
MLAQADLMINNERAAAVIRGPPSFSGIFPEFFIRLQCGFHTHLECARIAIHPQKEVDTHNYGNQPRGTFVSSPACLVCVLEMDAAGRCFFIITS